MTTTPKAAAAFLAASVLALGACGSGSEEAPGDDTEVSDALSELERSTRKSAKSPERELTADEAVRSYFRLLNQRSYEDAWKLLAPAVRDQFGGFETWVGGYETTKSTRIVSVKPSSTSSDSADLRVEIEAVDAGPCDEALVRGFAGPWSLERRGDEWTIAAASFEQTSGSSTSEACGGSAPVYYTDAAYQVSQRPSQVHVNNHDVLSGLAWQSWGSESATGTGTLQTPHLRTGLRDGL